MNTADLTLAQFLQQFVNGIATVFDDNQLKNIGCDPSNTSNMEVIKFDLVQGHEDGELLGFAVSYVLRLKYRDVFVTQSINSTSADQDDSAGMSCIGSVTGKNSDEDGVMINVTWNKNRAQFILTH